MAKPLSDKQAELLIKQRDKIVKLHEKFRKMFTKDKNIDIMEDGALETLAKRINELDDKLAKRGVKVPNSKASKSGSKGAAPPEHQIVAKKMFKWEVRLKDTNYQIEKLGSWTCIIEAGITATGQVYPLMVDLDASFQNPANKVIKYGPTVKARSVNLKGKRFMDVDFKVQVTGPNVTFSQGGSLGASVKWEDKASGVEAGVEGSWNFSKSTTNQAAAEWRRRFHISGGQGVTMALTQDRGMRKDLKGQLIIDDDDGHDGWGFDTDWHLHTYDG